MRVWTFVTIYNMLYASLVTVNDSNIELQHNLFQTVKTKLHFTLNSLEASKHQIMFAQSLKSIITNQLNQESKIRIHNDINVIVFPNLQMCFLQETRMTLLVFSLDGQYFSFNTAHAPSQLATNSQLLFEENGCIGMLMDRIENMNFSKYQFQQSHTFNLVQTQIIASVTK